MGCSFPYPFGNLQSESWHDHCLSFLFSFFLVENAGTVLDMENNREILLCQFAWSTLRKGSEICTQPYLFWSLS
jgi:hypothetical protein